MTKKYNILEIEQLSVNYGKKNILNDVNLTISEGETLGIIGQNGSGKSTLLKAMYSIVKPTCGRVLYKNSNICRLRPDQIQRQGIAYCLQGGLISPTLTVEENFKIVDKHLNGNLDMAMSYFPKISEFLKKRAGNLSGGERQMVSLSMLLMQNANLWFLDEPTAGLSATNVEQTLSFLSRVKEEQNISMVMVEHNYDFAFQLVDNIVIVKNKFISKKFEKGAFSKPDFIQENLM